MSDIVEHILFPSVSKQWEQIINSSMQGISLANRINSIWLLYIELKPVEFVVLDRGQKIKSGMK